MIYIVIGVIVLRTISSEYSFLQATSLSYYQNEVPLVAKEAYQNNEEEQPVGTLLNDDQDAEQLFTEPPDRSTTAPIIQCSKLSNQPGIFESCITPSSKYECQPTNTTDMEFQSTKNNCMMNSNATTSDPSFQAALRDILPRVLNELKVLSMIHYDGDSDDWKMFPFWVQYFGIGTSEDGISQKQRCFANDHIHFHRLDLTCTIPPPVDLIWLGGDLSLIPDPIRSALLYHIQESGVKYIMTARLDAEWFVREEQATTTIMSSPLFTSFDELKQQQLIGVWKSPSVEELPFVEHERENDKEETDDGEARDEVED